MEHSKDFYQSFIAFLEHACEKVQRDFSYEEGSSIAGDYWMAICGFLKERHLARVNYGALCILKFPPLLPIIADCRAALASIEKAEADRELANREKIENISYGKKAYRLAEKSFNWNKGNIVFTSLVALGQIIQWIVLIVQWLRHP